MMTFQVTYKKKTDQNKFSNGAKNLFKTFKRGLHKGHKGNTSEDQQQFKSLNCK